MNLSDLITDRVISSSATGGTEIPYQDEAPTSPSDGDLWVDKDATPSSTSASLLVAETVVSGSAVTSVTFSGLDGNVAGGYVLVVTAKNATANATGLQLTLNNDTTAANYNYKVIFKASTGNAGRTD